MIERILELNNIGVYQKGGCPKAELGKYVFIYGGNTRGKTTFSDILRSLKTNDSSIIIKRKRISKGLSVPSTVKLLMANKKEVCYLNDAWIISDGAENDVNNIQIFDINFVNENVFTNFNIEHKNKEFFTSFILGEEAIHFIKGLEEIESKISENNSELKRKIECYKDKTKVDYNLIVKIKLVNNSHDYDVMCLGLKSDINQQMSRKSKIGIIKDLNLLRAINGFENNSTKLKDVIEQAKEFFEVDLSILIQKFEEQKEKINNSAFTEEWVRTGIQICKSTKESCPFCGQALKDNNIVKLYTTLFSESLRVFVNKINLNIKALEKMKFNPSLELDIEKTKNQLIEIREYIETENGKKAISDFDNILNDYKDIIDNYKKAQNVYFKM